MIPPDIKKSKTIGQFKKNYKLFAASHASEAMEAAMEA
jgi:hypothetical protein